ncbi:MAG: cytidylate kinase-like family protein [Muribaculaceae bacterium]|nr:cytidylate kinase-like family protein [Muribaculaceae bacterium]
MSDTRLSSDLIVVVGRQFGSGGRKIGRMLADEFGLAYYDKEVLSEAAQRLGFSQEIFSRYDEKRPSAFRSLLSNTFGVQDSFHQTPMSHEAIYTAQGKVISELADEGGCVFVGRSADYILRHRPGLVSIFLHAPVEHRARMLVERGDEPDITHATEHARKIDRNREEFYNYYTGRHWGHADNYHLTLDTSLLGTEGTYSVIRTYIKGIIDKSKNAR